MANPLATITRQTGLGMITIRADLDRAGDAIAEGVGLAIPDTAGMTGDGTRILAWMSPDELMLMLPAAETPGAMTALEQALTGEHGLIVDMSDARAVFDVTGPDAADVISKLVPVDAAAMPTGHLRRSRAAQTAIAVWRHGDGFRLFGFRSTADYLELILQNAAIAGSQLAPR
ncbi:sarcosine oxidase subunit gamma [Paracoccus sp. JM45]|uniref:sarcosine oxidase subunit gamma n=1 Tax=Paracoccus sp. JM45 TaxID=2283626 RepID=UPI000E6C6E79|nr:sarcosine oxidase subunit gamma family protein [Paracoccus sp. JM45]RJE80528.1 sarcosine oxidase subunit gamma [Paracoccus sp. JM45]